MAHLQVLVDGKERFNGEVPTAILPKRDEHFPRALGQGVDTSQPMQMPPLMQLFLLTQMINDVVVPLLENPMFGQHEVKWEPRGVGSFVITGDGPPMTMDDLAP